MRLYALSLVAAMVVVACSFDARVSGTGNLPGPGVDGGTESDASPTRDGSPAQPDADPPVVPDATPTAGCDDCNGSEFCHYDDRSCGLGGEAGECKKRPSNGQCVGLFEPVCGCDGTTYSSECRASRAGVNVDYVGRCQDEAPVECSEDDPCVMCELNSVPSIPQLCQCLGCPKYPMPKSQCDALKVEWVQSCGTPAEMCPNILCAEPFDVDCDEDSGTCEIDF